MEGYNSVKMRGILKYPKFSATANGHPKFNGKIMVPIKFKAGAKDAEGQSYHNICAWGPVAEALGEMMDGTPIEIDGSLNSRSYDGQCKNCGGSEKKYWTEVQISHFIILDE